MKFIFGNFSNLNLIKSCSAAAVPTRAERKILKMFQSCTSSCKLLIWEQDFGAASTDDVHYMLEVGWGCFSWGQRPRKHQCVDWIRTFVLSQGCWLIWRVAKEQFQQCYQEQTEGDKGPLSSAGARQWLPMPPGCDSYSWIDGVWCRLCLCLPMCVCVCVCVCISACCVLVFTAGMEGIVFLCLPRDWKSLFHCT